METIKYQVKLLFKNTYHENKNNINFTATPYWENSI